jgi:type III secretion protein V
MMKRVRSAVGGILSSLQAGDMQTLFARYSGIGLATLVAVIIGMMIVPLPAFLLDLSIVLNISVAVVMLLIAIYVSDALKIATFPSLLLLTTLFRLAIEVSATRLILLKANAGQVIYAFGSFVVAGNLIVGIVVFLILTTIQYIVIAKGSGRVAEVGARFVLDAMPGRQMAIDAELRTGHIDHNEASRRRALLARESQFFGSMDGAMKYVKGDAIAGIMVLLVNIVAGLAIGVFQKGMNLQSALRTYTLLTIGEGLVAQIPALIISTAAGIVVTRVSSEEEGGHLGSDIGRQILSQPKALAIAAAFLVSLALIPGLPALPFLVLSILLGLLAYRLIGTKSSQKLAVETSSATPVSRSSPLLVPISVELPASLIKVMLDGRRLSKFVSQVLPGLQKKFFSETGIAIPQVHVSTLVSSLAEGTYVIRLNEIPIAHGKVVSEGTLIRETADRLNTLGVAAEPAILPDGTVSAWILSRDCKTVREQGLAVLLPEEVIADHLLYVLRTHGYLLIGIQETQGLLDELASTHPGLIREVVPKLVNPVVLADILQRLAREGISLRNLGDILSALAKLAPFEDDVASLAEKVRAALQRQITFKYSGPDCSLAVFFVDSTIEETLREAIRKTATSSYLALEPELSRDIVQAVEQAVAGTATPVILTTSDIRRHFRGLIENKHPTIAVLAYQELLPEAKLQALGRISV